MPIVNENDMWSKYFLFPDFHDLGKNYKKFPDYSRFPLNLCKSGLFSRFSRLSMNPVIIVGVGAGTLGKMPFFSFLKIL